MVAIKSKNSNYSAYCYVPKIRQAATIWIMSHLLFRCRLGLFFYPRSQIIGLTLNNAPSRFTSCLQYCCLCFLSCIFILSLLFQQSEDFFGLRRLYVILGSCLFYKVGVFFTFSYSWGILKGLTKNSMSQPILPSFFLFISIVYIDLYFIWPQEEKRLLSQTYFINVHTRNIFKKLSKSVNRKLSASHTHAPLWLYPINISHLEV